MRNCLVDEVSNFKSDYDNPKKYKYRLRQEAFPLDLTGATNLGEYGGMIKRSKITEGWGKNETSIIERTHNEKESCINTDRYKQTYRKYL
jgi:hypothetical protein